MDEISSVDARKAPVIDRVIETSRLQSASTADVIASSNALTELSRELELALSQFRTEPIRSVEAER
jgi:hypothetical protein